MAAAPGLSTDATEQSRPLRVALVEPFLGGSHRAWAEGLAQHSRHAVEIIGLPAVHWKWRMQGGHLAIADRIEASVAEHGTFDLLVATSMTNLSALLGLCRHTLGDIPVALYMHESQLTYPLAPGESEDLTYPMINHTAMAVADRVVFNSEFHRRAWFDAVPELLIRMPDHRELGLIEAIERRSSVLPVGVELARLERGHRTRSTRPLILWNQRWHHDKSPDDFTDAVIDLADLGYVFDLALAGERTDPEPNALVRLRDRLGDRIVHDGFADDDEYVRVLGRSDIVVSTAQQEFFGIALTEAIHAGAFPIVPDRLVYPERIPAEHHAACLYPDQQALVDRLRWAIERSDIAAAVVADLQSVMAEFDWPLVAPRYDELFESMTA